MKLDDKRFAGLEAGFPTDGEELNEVWKTHLRVKFLQVSGVTATEL